MPRHTTELQDRIIVYLDENGPSTVSQISEAFRMGSGRSAPAS